MSLHAYIAAPWELQAESAQLAGFLERAGAKTTSRWLHAKSPDLSDEWAMKCLRDVEACDVLLAFNPGEWARTGTGGRHVEVGYALAIAKPVIVVGERTNIFHFLRRVERVAIDGDMVANILAVAARRGFVTEDSRPHQVSPR